MVFSSLTFIYAFLPLMMTIYFAVPKKFKNLVLLLEGLVFYAWGEPVYILVVMATTFMDYIYGRLMDKHRDNKKLLKLLIIISVSTNVGILAVFKYSSFIITSVNAVFHLGIPDPHIPLPMGISFHTFQSMSYTIDMYFGTIGVQSNLISFCTFVTLYPQMVAGPIVRYHDVEHEINDRVVNLEGLYEGITRFVTGLAKKVLLADNIGAVWTSIQSTPADKLTLSAAWFGILCFAFQILFDFSGYSDMAIGLGRMMGFKIPENFNYPYLSTSITDFWRRWHITLGSWFRAYVYIPLGGNRCSKTKQVRNLLIVWALTGLWHGASWNFVIWGVYFGVIIILEKFILRRYLERLPHLLQVAYSFILVLLGWVFFVFDDQHDGIRGAISYFGTLFGANTHNTGLINGQTIYWMYTNAVIFVLCAIFATMIPARILGKLKFGSDRSAKFVRVMTPVLQVVAVLVCTAYLVSSTYHPFLYFRF